MLEIRTYYKRNKANVPIEARCLILDPVTMDISRGRAKCNREAGDFPWKKHGRHISKGRALEAMQYRDDILNKTGFKEGEYNPALTDFEKQLLNLDQYTDNNWTWTLRTSQVVSWGTV